MLINNNPFAWFLLIYFMTDYLCTHGPLSPTPFFHPMTGFLTVWWSQIALRSAFSFFDSSTLLACLHYATDFRSSTRQTKRNPVGPNGRQSEFQFCLFGVIQSTALLTVIFIYFLIIITFIVLITIFSIYTPLSQYFVLPLTCSLQKQSFVFLSLNVFLFYSSFLNCLICNLLRWNDVIFVDLHWMARQRSSVGWMIFPFLFQQSNSHKSVLRSNRQGL